MTEKPKKPSEPKHLGRGLSSLLGEVPITPAASENSSGKTARSADSLSSPGGASSVNQVRSLPIEWINPGPWQPRQIFEAERAIRTGCFHKTKRTNSAYFGSGKPQKTLSTMS